MARITKISSYPTPDKKAYENYMALVQAGKVVAVLLDGKALQSDHVFGADEKKGTVDMAVLGPEGHLQADPKHPPQITIQHGIKKLKKAGKYKKQRPIVVPSRVLTLVRKGVVRIIITDPVQVIEEVKTPPAKDKKPAKTKATVKPKVKKATKK